MSVYICWAGHNSRKFRQKFRDLESIFTLETCRKVLVSLAVMSCYYGNNNSTSSIFFMPSPLNLPTISCSIYCYIILTGFFDSSSNCCQSIIHTTSKYTYTIWFCHVPILSFKIPRCQSRFSRTVTVWALCASPVSFCASVHFIFYSHIQLLVAEAFCILSLFFLSESSSQSTFLPLPFFRFSLKSSLKRPPRTPQTELELRSRCPLPLCRPALHLSLSVGIIN